MEDSRINLQIKDKMKKIFQRIVSSDGTGDCVRAVVASIMDMEYEEVPDMSPNTGNQAGILINFMRENGYSYEGMLFNRNYCILYHANQLEYCNGKFIQNEDCLMNYENMNKLKGINGLFLATVLSPKFTNLHQNKWEHHQVICDIDLNVVFDPGPEYQDLKCYPLAELLGYNGICHIDIYEKEDM